MCVAEWSAELISEIGPGVSLCRRVRQVTGNRENRGSTGREEKITKNIKIKLDQEKKLWQFILFLP